MKKYASDKEIAKRYGVSRSCVWRWLQNDILPKPVQISPRCTRFDIEECDQRISMRKFEPKRIRKNDAKQDISA
jgi:predicted DNA-binding transcriptional regulator AlpA